MKTIKRIVQYECPETGDFFPTAEMAAESAAKFLKEKEASDLRKSRIEFMQNAVRLECENIQDLQDIIIDRFFDFTGEKLNIQISSMNFGSISNTHNCPINGIINWDCKPELPRGYLGWSGKLSGKNTKSVDGKKINENSFIYPTSYYFENFKCDFKGFKGIQTGSGGGDSMGWSFEFYAFLDDFPLLKKKYEDYQVLIQNYKDYLTKIEEEKKRVLEFANQNLDIINLDGKIISIDNQINDLILAKANRQKSRNELIVKITSQYTKTIKPNFNVKDYQNYSVMFKG